MQIGSQMIQEQEKEGNISNEYHLQWIIQTGLPNIFKILYKYLFRIHKIITVVYSVIMEIYLWVCLEYV